MNVMAGFIIWDTGVFAILPPKYNVGAVGGVTFPSPRLVPMMAAK